MPVAICLLPHGEVAVEVRARLDRTAQVETLATVATDCILRSLDHQSPVAVVVVVAHLTEHLARRVKVASVVVAMALLAIHRLHRRILVTQILVVVAVAAVPLLAVRMTLERTVGPV